MTSSSPGSAAAPRRRVEIVPASQPNFPMVNLCPGVASSAEDYYLGHGEAPGRWVGSLAAEMGLHGEVDPEHFAEGARMSAGAARHRRLPW